MVSTKQSILDSERVNLHAMNAEQQLCSTRRYLAQARYDHLMAWTELHYYAGTLRETDLPKVDEAFMRRDESQKFMRTRIFRKIPTYADDHQGEKSKINNQATVSIDQKI